MVEVMIMEQSTRTKELEREALLNARIKLLGGKPSHFSKKGKEMFFGKRLNAHPLTAGVATLGAKIRKVKAHSIKKARARRGKRLW